MTEACRQAHSRVDNEDRITVGDSEVLVLGLSVVQVQESARVPTTTRRIQQDRIELTLAHQVPAGRVTASVMNEPVHSTQRSKDGQ